MVLLVLIAVLSPEAVGGRFFIFMNLTASLNLIFFFGPALPHPSAAQIILMVGGRRLENIFYFLTFSPTLRKCRCRLQPACSKPVKVEYSLRVAPAHRYLPDRFEISS